jgi:hypothetical protein
MQKRVRAPKTEMKRVNNPADKVILIVVIVLGLLTSSVVADQRKYSTPDVCLLAADMQDASVVEGTLHGDFGTLCPGIYPGHSWRATTTQIATNGLFRVDFTVFRPGQPRSGSAADSLSILLIRPESASGASPVLAAEPVTKSPAAGYRLNVDASASRHALQAIEEVVVTAQAYTNHPEWYRFSGAAQALTFTARPPFQFLSPGPLGFQELQRVRIFIKQRGRRRSQLIMEHAPLFMQMRAGQFTAQQEVLAEDVSICVFEYWDVNRSDWVTDWTLTNSLPRKIRVSLGIGPPYGRNQSPHDLNTQIVALPGMIIPETLQGVVPSSSPPPNGAPNANTNSLVIGSVNIDGGKFSSVEAPEDSAVYVAETSADVMFDTKWQWLGRSGIEFARSVLSLSKERFTTLNQPWAGEWSLSLGDGLLSIEMVDLDRKFNINVADESALGSGLLLMGMDPLQHAAITDSLLDWRDPDNAPHANGAESDTYLGYWPPYVARNGPLDDLAELLLVHGIAEFPELYSRFKSSNASGNALGPNFVDLFTTLSGGRRININTASANVLQLFPEIDESVANAIISGPGGRNGPDRLPHTDDDTPFRSVEEIFRTGVDSRPAILRILQWCTVRSSVFDVRVQIRRGSAIRIFHGLVYLDPAGASRVLTFYSE